MRNRRKVAATVLTACVLVGGVFAVIRLATFFGWPQGFHPSVRAPAQPPKVQAPTPSPSVQAPPPAPTTQAPTPTAPPAPPSCGVSQVLAVSPSTQAPATSSTGYGGESLTLGRGALEGRDPTYAPDGMEIAFVKDGPGTLGTWSTTIWITSLDGRNLRPLTTSASRDPLVGSQPAWSPDGSRIAFVSSVSGSADIWVIGRDGSNLMRLTTNPDGDQQPTWSPNGTQIAFASLNTRISTIWIMNADGTGLRRVTNVTNPPGGHGYPSFSPDGNQIVFSRSVYAKVGAGHSYVGSHLAIVNADGTGFCELTTGNVSDSTPSWSKTGIAFSRSCCDLWLIKSDGSGLQVLPSTSGSNPVWSPDGTKIAFESSGHIYVFDLSDRTAKPLTQLNTLPIVIYINPGLANTINPKNKGNIGVAILSAPWFDPVRQIDQTSITFGPTGSQSSPASCVANDVNQDGIPDLVCEFDVAAKFAPTDTQAILKAKDANGFLFEGRDTVIVLPP